MKEKVIGFFKSNFFFAAALNLIIMIVVVFVSSFSYDTIDDLYNSLYICHYHYYYNNDINYILATIVGSIQYIFNNINCYVLGMVGLSYIAFSSITYVFADKFQKTKAFVFTIFINALFALSHYADVASSKTAAILLAAGFLLVLNAIRNKRYNLPFWLGVTEITFGSFYSFEYFFPTLGFALMFFAADMIAKRKYKIPFRKFFWYFRPFLLCFAFVILIVAGLNQYTVSVNNSSEEAAGYYKYCQLSDSINNLPYPNYKDYQNEFKEVGINSENEYELLKSGYYDDSTALNNDSLKLVYDIQQRSNSKTFLTELVNIFVDIGSDFATFNSTALDAVFLILTVSVFIIFQKKRYSFFPIFYLAAALASGVYIRYAFNGSDYMTYGIWLFTTVFLLFSFDFEHMRKFKSSEIFTRKKGKFCISLALMLALIVGMTVVYPTHKEVINLKERPTGLYLEISRHPERYYVIDPVTYVNYIKYSNNYIHPMWGFSSSFLKNVDTFGYFQKTEQRRNRGLSDNIYKAVLDNRYVYVIDNTITFKKEKYFSKYYSDNGNYVSYIQNDENSGYKLYKVITQ